LNTQQWIFLAVVFIVVVALAALAMMLLAPGPLSQRLSAFMQPASHAAIEGGGWIERVARIAQPFTKLSLPDEGWENSTLRTRFMNAGWRKPGAPAVFFAAKTVLALGLPTLMGLVTAAYVQDLMRNAFLLALLTCAAFGYYLPNWVLKRTAERRQREIFENLPDALDLLTVCVEAGLTMERAFQKVAGEIHIKSVVLAQELQLVLMEMRAGFTRDKALRNLALRTGVEDVDTLVAMLIQSERFGTTMGESLRIHSDNLRVKRRLMAEEMAAKIALKLLFPLVFCIFPTLMMVLLGPAVLLLQEVFA
jgi:tight adherence protein C